ncbi:hypothetical protein [Nonomuraea sp. NPDC052265]|uniref:hypothetical protein n=1 Tax=Nonomuraea sp. NPDC052265 TaxID=3364374 RepID=UPI0037C99AE0
MTGPEEEPERVRLVRATDLADLRFGFPGLSFKRPAAGRILVRAVPEREGLIVVTFPAQHVIEQAFFESAGAGLPDPVPVQPHPAPPVVSRISGRTTLVFVVGPGDEIPYTAEGLLAAMGRLPLRTVGDEGPADPLRDPAGDPRTAIELPYRLLLSPPPDVRWTHRTAPADDSGRVELWHTRVRDTRARAVWTRDFPGDTPVEPPPDPLTTSLTPADRAAIVHLTSDRGLVTEPGHRPYVPAPVEVGHLILSALGGWLDALGSWDPRPAITNVSQWRHRTAMGRDHHVRVLYSGYLCPFGHRADLVKVTERTFDPQRPEHPAYLAQRLFITWSLAAPLPGRTLDRFGRPVVADPEVDANFPLDTKFTPVPGSLPALRYGRTYRLRARVVDLAGNAPEPAAEAPGSALSRAITYSRWEPVPPPAIVERKPFNEGESSQCMVIRSTVTAAGRDVPAWEWALDRQDVPGHTDHPPATDGLSRRYLYYDERFVAPPKTSLQMAERHGRFDDAVGGDRPQEVRRRFFTAAAREAGTFLDTVVSYAGDPSRTRDLLFFGEIAVAKHDASDPEPVTPLPVTRGAGLKQGEFVVHTAAELILPYLPDVLARGVTLYGLPGAAPIHPVPFYDDFHDTWPDAAPFTLRIEEGDEPPRWRDVPRRLTVYLPKAEMATVRLSCRLTAADLALLPVWQRLLVSDFWRGLTDAERELIADETVAGLNWLLTPYTELRLVHAVERPLSPPALGGTSFVREPEQTFADLRGTLRSHPRSTGHVDIDATWTRWLDDPTEPAPRRIKEHAHVGRVELSYSDRDEVRLPHAATPVRHDFGDTLHRNVVYRPTATTRFREYFHPSITADPALVTSAGEPSAGPAGRGWPVPASRRPEPPKPSYLLPTFRWNRREDRRDKRFVTVRDGAGVRVYLDRPWFSSGDDELLAVVLDPPGGDPLPGHLATRWGADPVWSDTTVLPPPAPANFPGPVAAPAGLRLAESGEGRELVAAVAAYQPSYDAAKGLWFADVDVDLGAAGRESAYFPYLRLALARYQPHALPGLELSSVVRAEFAQLVPGRTLTVEEVSGGGLRVTLAGPAAATELGAQAGAGLPAVAASHRVTATVQRRPFTSIEDLDWTDTPIRAELTCAATRTGFQWSGVIPPVGLDIIWQYRLLVEDRERYRTDPGTADETVAIDGTRGGTAGIDGSPGVATSGGRQRIPVAERLVHADSVPLRARLGRLVIDFDA